MSKRNLEIVFENPSRRFVAGERIRGEVVVEVEKDTKCKGLTIFQAWYTHGRGNSTEGSHDTLHLFTGEWSPGTYRYPFEFEAQPGPFTYHGDYLNVDWYLSAQADVPWAFDPKVEEDFLLSAPPQGLSDPGYYRTLSARASASGTLGSQKHVLLFGAGGAATVFALVMWGVAWAAGEVGFAVFAGIVTIAALVFLALGIHRVLAVSKVGEVAIELAPAPASPGAEVTASMSFTVQGDAELNEASVTIAGKERVVSGSGTDRTTHTNTFFEQRWPLSQARQLRAGEDVTLSATFELPADAPFSFDASDNDLLWEATFHLDIAKWPDWKETRALVVAPRVAW